VQKEHLKIAQQYFQLVGGSASECGKLYLVTGLIANVLNMHIPCSGCNATDIINLDNDLYGDVCAHFLSHMFII